MKIEEIQSILNNNLELTETKSLLNIFNSKVTFEGGIVQNGVLYAKNRNDAIIRSYNVLKDQDMLEIVLDIECFEKT